MDKNTSSKIGNLSFIFVGDWNMTTKKMMRTNMTCSIGAVINKPAGVEFTCASGNRLLDYAFPALRSQRGHSGTIVASPVEIARDPGNPKPQSAAHHRCDNSQFGQRNSAEKRWDKMLSGTSSGGTFAARDQGNQTAAKKHCSTSLRIH